MIVIFRRYYCNELLINAFSLKKDKCLFILWWKHLVLAFSLFHYWLNSFYIFSCAFVQSSFDICIRGAPQPCIRLGLLQSIGSRTRPSWDVWHLSLLTGLLVVRNSGNIGVRMQLYSWHRGKLQTPQGSRNKSKALWGKASSYYKLNSCHTYSPIISVKDATLMLHCGLCLPKGSPHCPANMFLLFLARTRSLCMHQNTYCSHKTSDTERKSISFKLTHSKKQTYLHQAL